MLTYLHVKNLAVVEDTIAPVFNHMGNSDNYTSQDGSA